MYLLVPLVAENILDKGGVLEGDFPPVTEMLIQVSLLDFLAYKAECQISDLPTVAKEEPIRISHSVMWLRPGSESLAEWNDALDYLFQLPPAESCEEARKQMIMALHHN